MVESGQVQLGNHTWSHRDLTTLSGSGIAGEITRNGTLLTKTYGVSGRPFLRPPFGFHNARVRRIAAELGYPTMAMWYGRLSDSSPLPAARIMHMVRRWVTAERIVIGHANHPGIIDALPDLPALITTPRLHTVTLDDVYSRA